jgi:hypothetical protein
MACSVVAIEQYRQVFSTLGLRPATGFEDEIRAVTQSIEQHDGAYQVLCQGDQNSMEHVFRTRDGLRMMDFGVAGFRHALIEGMPHRLTWGCVRRIPRRLFAPMEDVYRVELARSCRVARDEAAFRRVMAEAGGRWSVLHVVHRVADALNGDRPRGRHATLRQQVLASISAFSVLSEEVDQLPALGQSAAALERCLRARWPDETHYIPPYPAFAAEDSCKPQRV